MMLLLNGSRAFQAWNVGFMIFMNSIILFTSPHLQKRPSFPDGLTIYSFHQSLTLAFRCRIIVGLISLIAAVTTTVSTAFSSFSADLSHMFTVYTYYLATFATNGGHVFTVSTDCFSAFTTDSGHVGPVFTHSFAPFAGYSALLFRVHRRETPV
jgi:hypothetical protein